MVHIPAKPVTQDSERAGVAPAGFWERGAEASGIILPSACLSTLMHTRPHRDRTETVSETLRALKADATPPSGGTQCHVQSAASRLLLTAAATPNFQKRHCHTKKENESPHFFSSLIEQISTDTKKYDDQERIDDEIVLIRFRKFTSSGKESSENSIKRVDSARKKKNSKRVIFIKVPIPCRPRKKQEHKCFEYESAGKFSFHSSALYNSKLSTVDPPIDPLQTMGRVHW